MIKILIVGLMLTAPTVSSSDDSESYSTLITQMRTESQAFNQALVQEQMHVAQQEQKRLAEKATERKQFLEKERMFLENQKLLKTQELVKIKEKTKRLDKQKKETVIIKKLSHKENPVYEEGTKISLVFGIFFIFLLLITIYSYDDTRKNEVFQGIFLLFMCLGLSVSFFGMIISLFLGI